MVISSKCAGCHSGGSPKGDLNITIPSLEQMEPGHLTQLAESVAEHTRPDMDVDHRMPKPKKGEQSKPLSAYARSSVLAVFKRILDAKRPPGPTAENTGILDPYDSSSG
jgi:hypothetical protein